MNGNTLLEWLDSDVSSADEWLLLTVPPKSTTYELQLVPVEKPAITTPCPFARTITDWGTTPYTFSVGKLSSGTTE